MDEKILNAEHSRHDGHAPRVQPGPLPIDVGISVAQAARGPDLVVLTCMTPAGQSFYFLSAESAEEIGKKLVAAAAQARSGIVLVPSGSVPPPTVEG